MSMPARQISAQSFDQILSELGDDPAIPDPHGIRKPSAPKHVAPQAPSHAKPQPAFGALGQLELFSQTKKLGLFLASGALLLALFISGLTIYKSILDDGNADVRNQSFAFQLCKKKWAYYEMS